MECKICVCCKQNKSILDFFRYSKNIDGRMNRCKECHNESVKKSRNKNLDHVNKVNQKYRELNREKIRNYNLKKYHETKVLKPLIDYSKCTTKKCGICNEEKLFSEFNKNKRLSFGLEYACRQCVSKKMKIYRSTPEEKEKMSEYAKQYNSKNSERVKARSLRYYYNNLPRRKFISKIWRQKNKAYIKIHSKEYRLNNKALCNTYCHARRARLRASIHPNHSKQIEKIFQELAIRVSACSGIKFNVDHILPLNAGGVHHHLNLQIIPAIINFGKRDNINYRHSLLIHWTELPKFLLPTFYCNGGSSGTADISGGLPALGGMEGSSTPIAAGPPAKSGGSVLPPIPPPPIPLPIAPSSGVIP